MTTFDARRHPGEERTGTRRPPGGPSYRRAGAAEAPPPRHRGHEGLGPAATLPLAATLLLLTVPACTGARSFDAPPDRTVTFLYDRSSSVEPRLLLSARELTRRHLQTLRAGDRLMVWALGGDGDPDRWSTRVPVGWPDGGEDFVDDVRDRVVDVTDTTRHDRHPGSDLVRALEAFTEEMERHPDSRHVLYIFSDMLQVGRGLNFEAPDFRAPMEWLSEAASEGGLPALKGVCVVVLGPRGGTARDRHVRAFWEAFFQAAGAELAPENYTPRLSRLPEAPCPGLPGAPRPDRGTAPEPGAPSF